MVIDLEQKTSTFNEPSLKRVANAGGQRWWLKGQSNKTRKPIIITSHMGKFKATILMSKTLNNAKGTFSVSLNDL